LEDLDVARARFAELRPDPTRLTPNTASRIRDRTHELFTAGDWEGLRAFVSEDFVFEERRKHTLLTGGVDLWIESMKHIGPGTAQARELIATFGDRIALDRLGWRGDDGLRAGVHWEADTLRLTEVDADGRLRASISFEIDDQAEACAEGATRFVGGEAAGTGAQDAILAFSRASRRDWEAARRSLADDFVLHDHRQLGLGTLGPDDWIASLRIGKDELTSQWKAETLCIFAWNARGRVDAGRQYGTVRDGGPFETVFVRVVITEGDRIRRMEIYAMDDVQAALARFEELCADGASP